MIERYAGRLGHVHFKDIRPEILARVDAEEPDVLGGDRGRHLLPDRRRRGRHRRCARRARQDRLRRLRHHRARPGAWQRCAARRRAQERRRDREGPRRADERRHVGSASSARATSPTPTRPPTGWWPARTPTCPATSGWSPPPTSTPLARPNWRRRGDAQRSHDDWREITRADDIDVVDICVPNVFHAEVACDALAHGKHVICEKPIAHTWDGRARHGRCGRRSQARRPGVLLLPHVAGDRLGSPARRFGRARCRAQLPRLDAAGLRRQPRPRPRLAGAPGRVGRRGAGRPRFAHHRHRPLPVRRDHRRLRHHA